MSQSVKAQIDIRWAALLLAAVAVIFAPTLLNAIWIKVLTSAAIFALAANGVAVVYARLGMVNLAQVALVGIGGWIMLRLNYATTLPFELSLLISAIGCALIGMILALPAMRIRGLYLALVTLMAASAIQITLNAVQFPNGGSGFLGVAMQSPGEMRRPLLAQSDSAYFRFVCVVVAMCMLFVVANEQTRPGRAWSMIKRSEANAMAVGVNVTIYKVWAFMLSGFCAGIAGGLLAGALQILDSRSFIAGESILLFALTVVGGVYHWLGAIIAGLLYKALPPVLNNWGLDADLSLVIFGAALLHAITTAEKGIADQIISAFCRIGKRHAGGHS